METIWLLASEEGGFGLNLDILETNIINLVIIIGVLVYFGGSFFGKILSERRNSIETAIKDAESRQKKAALGLAEQQKQLQEAQAEGERIKAEARDNAERVRVAVLAQADKDVERMKASAQQDLSTQQERVLRELKQRVASMALDRVEANLPGALTGDVQSKLVDQSIALLGGKS
ncbi:MAG: F0F1 ATP synthase subunit B [Cyanobacteria bacterium P01_D01_bin.156]